jgi:acyl dehydratase
LSYRYDIASLNRQAEHPTGGFLTPMTQVSSDVLDQLRSRIGQDTPPGDWLLVTQERVNQFADVTDDHQFIHVDPERAKQTPFGGTIAHGFLTLSLCLMLPRYRADGSAPPPASETTTGPRPRMSVNYGLNKVRFPAPVPVGKRIRGSTRLLSVEEVAPGVVQNVTQITIELEDSSKPAAVIEMVGRHYY